MNRALRIAVADDEPRMRDFYQQTLSSWGHQVTTARTGTELVEQCRSHKPDLVISDIRMPGLDGIEAARQICKDEPVPVILVSAYFDDQLIERAAEHHVMAYLIKPIKPEDLEPAIAIALRRGEEFKALNHEAASLRQALQDRKLIERAKGLLMKKLQLDEADAFHRLQKLARDKNRKLVEIAEMVLTVEEALGSGEAVGEGK